MPNVKIRKRKSKRLKEKSYGMISTDQLKTILVVEEAKKYEWPPDPKIEVKGYDDNFPASVNAMNVKLKHEEEFITPDFTKINLIRILYPLGWFYLLIGWFLYL